MNLAKTKRNISNESNKKILEAFLLNLLKNGSSPSTINRCKSIILNLCINFNIDLALTNPSEVSLWFENRYRNNPVSTRKTMQSKLKQFSVFCLQNGYINHPLIYTDNLEKLETNIQTKIKEYLAWIQNKGVSQETIYNSKSVLVHLYLYLSDNLLELTIDNIESWLQLKYSNENSTLKNKSIIRGFLDYCFFKGYSDIRYIKSNNLPVLIDEQSQKIINEYTLHLEKKGISKLHLRRNMNITMKLIEDIKSLKNIKESDLVSWVEKKYPSVSVKYKQNIKSILKMFCYYLYSKGYLDTPFFNSASIEQIDLETGTAIMSFVSDTPIKNVKKTAEYILSNMFLYCNKSISTIKTVEIESWMSEKGYSKAYRKNVIYIIRKFSSFCLNHGYIDRHFYQNKNRFKTVTELYNSLHDFNKFVIDEYLFPKEINLKMATIKSYKTQICKMLLQIDKSLEEIKPDEIRNWLYSYYEGKKPKTNHKMYKIISAFLKFCYNEGHIKKPLIQKYWRPKVPQTLPEPICKEIMAQIDMHAEKLCLRNRALIEFFYSTGARLNEVANLKMSNLDLDTNSISVTGKGDKERNLFFSEKYAFLLEDLIKTNNPKEDALFQTVNGTPLSKSRIYEIVTDFGKTINVNVYPRRFRYTFATMLCDDGQLLEDIADLMGHENKLVTRGYILFSPKILKELYKKYRRY